MILFRYDEPLLHKFPTTRGGMIRARNLNNSPTPPALVEAFRAEQLATLNRIGETPLSEIPSLSAWRRAFSGFGVKPTQYRSAAEALLRRLTKQGDIPNVNMLVDMGNLVSIRYGLPIAVLDLTRVHGTITVKLASGDEKFVNLDNDEADNPAPGEVIFIDDSGLVHARRWCWRQSDQSAARDSTTDVLITIEGHHAEAEQDILAAITDLETLLVAYIPEVQLEHAQLSPDIPVFDAE